MKSYSITKADHGYIVRLNYLQVGMPNTEEYAFSTFREMHEYLPQLFEEPVENYYNTELEDSFFMPNRTLTTEEIKALYKTGIGITKKRRK